MQEKIWIVMCEQYYANHVSYIATCDNLAAAVIIAKDGVDRHIYEANMNEEGLDNEVIY